MVVGGGIFGTVLRVLGYLLAIASIAAIICVVSVAVLQPAAPQDAGVGGATAADPYTTALRSVSDSVRSVFGYHQRGGVGAGGGAVGRAVMGVDPPSIAERLAAVSLAPSSQHVVTPAQEVVMTGSSPTASGCLGADNEVMLEVQNDIGADQLDISYAFENIDGVVSLSAAPTTGDTSLLASLLSSTTPIKIASCGPRSLIKQCIPLPPSGQGVRLHTLTYRYIAAASTGESSSDSDMRLAADDSTSSLSPQLPVLDSDGMVTLPPKRLVTTASSSVREEKMIYPSLLDTAYLRSISGDNNGKVGLSASAFMLVPDVVVNNSIAAA